MMENAFSIGDISRRLEVPLHRVEYLLRTLCSSCVRRPASATPGFTPRATCSSSPASCVGSTAEKGCPMVSTTIPETAAELLTPAPGGMSAAFPENRMGLGTMERPPPP